MTKLENVKIFTLETVLNKATLDEIKKTGFSRIPISLNAEKNVLIGILLAKSLVGYKIKN